MTPQTKALRCCCDALSWPSGTRVLDGDQPMSPRNPGHTGGKDMTSVKKKASHNTVFYPLCTHARTHVHVHTAKPRNKCYLLCLLSCLTLLLVLATESNWPNVFRDQTVMTPRSLMWVLTERPKVFPALRIKGRKQKHSGLIISASCRNAFPELPFDIMPV